MCEFTTCLRIVIVWVLSLRKSRTASRSCECRLLAGALALVQYTVHQTAQINDAVALNLNAIKDDSERFELYTNQFINCVLI